MRMGFSLATVGIAVSVAVMAVGAHYLLGLPWELAILLGAVCSPTDAAAVFSVLRVVPLPRRITGALESESGLNDAPTVVLVTLVSTGAVGDHGVPRHDRHHRLRAGSPACCSAWRSGSAAPGSCAGRRCRRPVSTRSRSSASRSSRTPPGPRSHASGFAAVYVAALVLGNAELPHRAATKSFSEGVAWLAQIGLFVMLGLLLSPERITLGIVGLAVVAGFLLTMVARPVSVAGQRRSRSRCRWRDLAFISWAGLRGAVPIVLTTIPLAEGVGRRREALRHRLRDGRDLHAADRADAARRGALATGGPALGAARPRRRGGAAGADRRGPAPDQGQPGLAPARRRGR